MIKQIADTRGARDAAGSKTIIEVGVRTAFGCTIQGDVPESEVVRLLHAALDVGVRKFDASLAGG